MKLIGALLGAGFLGLILIANIVDPKPVRADAVETANKHLTADQRDLKAVAIITKEQAGKLATDAASPDKGTALPGELQAFNRTTERLTTLRARLQADVAEYKNAYAQQLEEFDNERGQITSSVTQRTINQVRRQVEDDMNERVQNAKATLDQLDLVLAQGADLQHAAKCVLIADGLHQHGEDVDQQLKDAKTSADTYAATTTSLLNRINQALAE